MGKRKRSRSRDRDYDHILRKLKKITSKSRKRRRSASSTSSSDGDSSYKRYYDYNPEEYNDDSYNMDYPGEDNYDSCENPETAQYEPAKSDTTAQRASSVFVVPQAPTVLITPPTPHAPTAPHAPLAPFTSTAPSEQPTANEADLQTSSADSEIVPTLDPEILQLLGEDPTNQKKYGENLHKDIAPRWVHILTNGLTKDTQLELAKRYLPPENCPYIRAPILNLEIKAALPEINAKKDLYSQSKQNQLSSSLAAIGQVLSWALSSNNIVPQDIIKTLSDAGRLICDSHYKESQSRRYAVLYTLDKSVRDTVKNTKIDEHLFGSALSEHIKSSKAIIKTGSEMKPATLRPPYKPPVGTQPQRGALNSRGAPPRVAAAAEPRPPPAPRRPPRDRRLQALRGRRPTGYSRHQARRRY